MIIVVNPHTPPEVAEAIAARCEGTPVTEADGARVVVAPSSYKSAPAGFDDAIAAVLVFDDDLQMGSLRHRPRRRVAFGGVEIGGDGCVTVMAAGPCSVESPEQIETVAARLAALGVKCLRAGAYKPRTSPYTFQGLGRDGLALLRRTADRHGMAVVSEARDGDNVADVLEFADVVQVGAKAMYDHAVLRACGRSRKTVLLKRGFGATLQEFVQAAEFILSGGNTNVVLCERGIRTFETKTRFTLDLCGVAWIKEKVNLPIVVDPSHAMGYRYGVPDLTRAAFAMGVDGLLIEVHPTPDTALSDAAQQLDLDAFDRLYADLAALQAPLRRFLR